MDAIRKVDLPDRVGFGVLFALEHYFPKSSVISSYKNKVRHRFVDEVRRGGEGRVVPVDRVPASLGPGEFRSRYLTTGTPVILEQGAASWPCSRQWSFDAFRQRFGHEKIKLVQRKGLSDDDFIDEREFSEEILFSDFIDQLISGGRKYMRFSPLLEKFPELIRDFDGEFFRRMSGNNIGVSYQLFMGATGTFTPLHNAMQPFFFVNVRGVKRWALIPPRFLPILNPPAEGTSYNHSDLEIDAPKLDEYPGFESIDRYEAVMNPGDVLYVPPWMWHSVQNESDTIGVRCGFIDPVGMLTGSPALAFIRFFASRNASIPAAFYRVVLKTNLAERDTWLLTPKLIRHRRN